VVVLVDIDVVFIRVVDGSRKNDLKKTRAFRVKLTFMYFIESKSSEITKKKEVFTMV
jgi:hypothetical protein